MPPITSGTFVGGFYAKDMQRKFTENQLIFSADEELQILSEDLIGATLNLFAHEEGMAVCNVHTVIINSSATNILARVGDAGELLTWSTPLRFDYSFYTDTGELDLPNTIKNIAQGVLMEQLGAFYPIPTSMDNLTQPKATPPYSILHDTAIFHRGGTGQLSVWLIHQVADGVGVRNNTSPSGGFESRLDWQSTADLPTKLLTDESSLELVSIFERLLEGNNVSRSLFSYDDLQKAYNAVLSEEAGPL